MPQFDLDGARKKASDRQIADYLAAQLNYDADAARASGASDSQIAEFLASQGGPEAPGTPAAAPAPVEVTELPLLPGTEASPPVKTAAEVETPLALADIPELALRNAPGSAVEFGKAMVQPFLHPILTAQSLGDIGAGIIQHVRNLSPEGQQGSAPKLDTATADAVGQFYVSRYGSVEGFKKALANDPVGVLADAASVLTLGGGAAARAPGVVGTAGRIAARVGDVVDPVNIALRTASGATNVGGTVARNILGATTGAGPEGVREAFLAGRRRALAPAIALAGDTDGAQIARNQDAAFVGQMRGTDESTAPIAAAREAVGDIRRDASRQYDADMAGIRADPTILDFTPIDAALDASRGTAYHGSLIKNDPAVDVWERIAQYVDEYRNAPPSEGRTAIALDALKQRIQKLGEALPMDNRPGKKAAGDVARTLKAQIADQAPEYLPTMDAYSAAQNQLDELERTLQLGENSTPEATLRNMQSMFGGGRRFDRRGELYRRLEDAGAHTVLPAAAGTAFREWYPRRLSALGANSVGVPAAGALSVATGNPLPFLAAIMAASPRTVGEATRYAGMGSAYPSAAARVAAELYGRGRSVLPKVGLVGQGEDTLEELTAKYSRGYPEDKVAEPLPEPKDDPTWTPEMLGTAPASTAAPSPNVPPETAAFVSSLSPQEAKALAIVGEASPNPAEMRAVAHVVENRIKNPERYGGDVYAVLTGGEFDAFRSPPEKLQQLMSSDRFNKALQLVEQVESGKLKADPRFKTTTHFLAPELMRQKGYKTPAWAKNGFMVGKTMFFNDVD